MALGGSTGPDITMALVAGQASLIRLSLSAFSSLVPALFPEHKLLNCSSLSLHHILAIIVAPTPAGPLRHLDS